MRAVFPTHIVLAPEVRHGGGLARAGYGHSSTRTNKPCFSGSRFAREILT